MFAKVAFWNFAPGAIFGCYGPGSTIIGNSLSRDGSSNLVRINRMNIGCAQIQNKLSPSYAIFMYTVLNITNNFGYAKTLRINP